MEKQQFSKIHMKKSYNSPTAFLVGYPNMNTLPSRRISKQKQNGIPCLQNNTVSTVHQSEIEGEWLASLKLTIHISLQSLGGVN